MFRAIFCLLNGSSWTPDCLHGNARAIILLTVGTVVSFAAVIRVVTIEDHQYLPHFMWRVVYTSTFSYMTIFICHIKANMPAFQQMNLSHKNWPIDLIGELSVAPNSNLPRLKFFVCYLCIRMWYSNLNDMEIPETKRFIPKAFELATTLS